jgi:YgiT-type zinc finger domain-containing protein
MDCPICGAEGRVTTEIARKYHFKWKDKSLTVENVEYLYCHECNDTFFNKEQSSALSGKIAHLVNAPA